MKGKRLLRPPLWAALAIAVLAFTNPPAARHLDVLLPVVRKIVSRACDQATGDGLLGLLGKATGIQGNVEGMLVANFVDESFSRESWFVCSFGRVDGTRATFGILGRVFFLGDAEELAGFVREAEDWGVPVGDLEDRARAGDAAAKRMLGRRKLDGLGCPAAPRDGVALLREAAAAGDAPAYVFLGDALGRGKGVRVDFAEAFRNYERAVRAGVEAGRLRAGLALLEGRGTDRNPEKGMKWIQGAAEGGDWSALLALGGISRRENADSPSRAARWDRRTFRAALSAAKRRGDPLAMEQAGRMLAAGVGCRRDPARAASFLERSWEAGNAAAAERLGDLFDPDLPDHHPQAAPDLSRDWRAKAFAKRLEAARAEDAEAMMSVARSLLRGAGAERDAKEAVRWFERAAKAGVPEACMELGRCYEEGDGVRASRRKALKWYRRGADAGDSRAGGKVRDLAR